MTTVDHDELPTMLAAQLELFGARKERLAKIWDLLFLAENSFRLHFFLLWMQLTSDGAVIHDDILADVASRVDLMTFGTTVNLVERLGKLDGVSPEMRDGVQKLVKWTNNNKITNTRNSLAHPGDPDNELVLEDFEKIFFQEGTPKKPGFFDAISWMRDLVIVTRNAEGMRVLLKGVAPRILAGDEHPHARFADSAPADEVVAVIGDRSFPIWPLVKLGGTPDRSSMEWYVRYNNAKMEYASSDLKSSKQETGRNSFLQLFHSSIAHLFGPKFRWNREALGIKDWMNTSTKNCLRRENELRLLHDIADNDDGDGIHMVTGFPGTGKSALLGSFANERHLAGADVDSKRIVLPVSFEIGVFRGKTGCYARYLVDTIEELYSIRNIGKKKSGSGNNDWEALENAIVGLPEDYHVLLVVDGLDTAMETERDFPVRLDRLTRGVDHTGKKIVGYPRVTAICSRRAGVKHAGTTGDYTVREVFAGGTLPALDENDLVGVLTELSDNLLQAVIERGKQDEYFHRIAECSRGSLFYFHQVIDMLKSGEIDPGDSSQLPRDSAEVFARQQQRHGLGNNALGEVITWVSLAKDSLSLPEIAALAKFENRAGARFTSAQIGEALQNAHMDVVYCCPDIDGEFRYSLFNESNRELYLDDFQVQAARDMFLKSPRKWLQIEQCLQNILGPDDTDRSLLDKAEENLVDYGCFAERDGKQANAEKEMKIVEGANQFLFSFYPSYFYASLVDHLLDAFETDRRGEKLNGDAEAVARLVEIDSILCNFTFIMERLRRQKFGDIIQLRAEATRLVNLIAGLGDAARERTWLVREWLVFLNRNYPLFLRADNEWTVDKILLQRAVEHGLDTRTTKAAQEWLKLGRCDWGWVKKAVVPQSPEPLRKHPNIPDPKVIPATVGDRTGVLYLGCSYRTQYGIPWFDKWNVCFLDCDSEETICLWEASFPLDYLAVENFLLIWARREDATYSVYCLDLAKDPEAEQPAIWEERDLVVPPRVRVSGGGALVLLAGFGNLRVREMAGGQWSPPQTFAIAGTIRDCVPLEHGYALLVGGNLRIVGRSAGNVIFECESGDEAILTSLGDSLLLNSPTQTRVFLVKDGGIHEPVSIEPTFDNVELINHGRHLLLHTFSRIDSDATRPDNLPEDIFDSWQILAIEPSDDSFANVLGEVVDDMTIEVKPVDNGDSLLVNSDNGISTIDLESGAVCIQRIMESDIAADEFLLFPEFKTVVALFENTVFFFRQQNSELVQYFKHCFTGSGPQLHHQNHSKRLYGGGSHVFFTDGLCVWHAALAESPRDAPVRAEFLAHARSVVKDVFMVDGDRACIVESDGSFAIHSPAIASEPMPIVRPLRAWHFDKTRSLLQTLDFACVFSVWEVSAAKPLFELIARHKLLVHAVQQSFGPTSDGCMGRSTSDSTIVSCAGDGKTLISSSGMQIFQFNGNYPGSLSRIVGFHGEEAENRVFSEIDTQPMDDQLIKSAQHHPLDRWLYRYAFPDGIIGQWSPFAVMGINPNLVVMTCATMPHEDEQGSARIHYIILDFQRNRFVLHSVDNMDEREILSEFSKSNYPQNHLLACRDKELLVFSPEPDKALRMIRAPSHLIHASWRLAPGNSGGDVIHYLTEKGESGLFSLEEGLLSETTLDNITLNIRSAWLLPNPNYMIVRNNRQTYALLAVDPNGKCRTIRKLVTANADKLQLYEPVIRVVFDALTLLVSPDDGTYCFMDTDHESSFAFTVHLDSIATFIHCPDGIVLDVSAENVRVLDADGTIRDLHPDDACRLPLSPPDASLSPSLRQKGVRWLEERHGYVESCPPFRFSRDDDGAVIASTSSGIEELHFMWGNTRVSRMELARLLFTEAPEITVGLKNTVQNVKHLPKERESILARLMRRFK